VELTACEIIVKLNDAVFGFYSTEFPLKKVSKSELRRWFEKKSVWFNGKAVDKDDVFGMERIEIILHPHSKRRWSFIMEEPSIRRDNEQRTG
jgi:hypothetical protein